MRRHSAGWGRPPGTSMSWSPATAPLPQGPEVAARLAADHAYIDALRRGEEPVDARLGPDWLPIHQSNLEQARRR